MRRAGHVNEDAFSASILIHRQDVTAADKGRATGLATRFVTEMAAMLWNRVQELRDRHRRRARNQPSHRQARQCQGCELRPCPGRVASASTIRNRVRSPWEIAFNSLRLGTIRRLRIVIRGSTEPLINGGLKV
jgi:hypothetical protein